jgi:hypothetical protein
VSLEAIFGKLFGKVVSLARVVDVSSHAAAFTDSGQVCQFIRITNRSINRKAVITEVWFDFSVRIPVLNSSRPMPITLPPEEVWDTWLPIDAIPIEFRASASSLARVRLSDGTILKSVPTKDVSEAGFVAGGEMK